MPEDGGADRDDARDGWDARVPEATLLPDGRIVGPDHRLKEERDLPAPDAAWDAMTYTPRRVSPRRMRP